MEGCPPPSREEPAARPVCQHLSFLNNRAASLLSTQARQNMGQTEGKVMNSYRKSKFNPLVRTCFES